MQLSVYDNKTNVSIIIHRFLDIVVVEREDVQKKTFTNWINVQLSKGERPVICDLFEDLKDGTQLLGLLEILTGISMVSKTEHYRRLPVPVVLRFW